VRSWWRSSGNSMASSELPPTGIWTQRPDSDFGKSRRVRSWLASRHISRSKTRRPLPKSPLGTAIGFALRNWGTLTRYTEDGRLKYREQRRGVGTNRSGSKKLSVCWERSGGAPHGHPVFVGADLQPPVARPVRVSTRCHRARLDPSGAARLGADPERMEAAPGGRRCTVCCMNDSLLPRTPS
jgi:hypothetical protein